MTVCTGQAGGAQRLARATALAATLLQGHRLGTRLPLAAATVGRALVATSPKSDHGQLLARALQAATDGRPADERAVLWLARRGEIPTAAAVAARIEGEARHHAAAKVLRAVADWAAAEDGPQASEYVAAVLAETGTGPTWRELGAALGWPRRPHDTIYVIITRLAAAGWLDQGDKTARSLRPGRKYKADPMHNPGTVRR